MKGCNFFLTLNSALIKHAQLGIDAVAVEIWRDA
jgi:hypothetical protein